MTEQWQELKETIIELRDSDGTGTQQEVCKFLTNYMEVLEKQMQEPCGDAISRQAVLDMMRMRMSGKELYKAVYDLPPVNPQPCGDLISRKAILEEFENDQYHLEFCKEHHIERSISMEMVRIRLHDLPPVTPQSKTGRWIYGEDNLGTGRDGWYCNQCGHFEFWDYSSDMKSAKLNLPNPCPNCGAKMIEPQERNEKE